MPPFYPQNLNDEVDEDLVDLVDLLEHGTFDILDPNEDIFEDEDWPTEDDEEENY